MDITEGICSGFSDKFSDSISAIDTAKSVIEGSNSALNSAMNNLIGQSATPENEMNTGLDSISGAISGASPSIPNTGDVESILQNCGILKGNLLDGTQNIMDLVSGFMEKALDVISDVISDIFNAIGNLIEAPLAFLIHKLNKLLSDFKFPDLLSGLDGLLSCADSVCGTNIQGDIQSNMDYINNTLDSLNINDKGEFDTDKLFSKFEGIPTDIKKNVTDLVSKTKEEADKSAEQVAKAGESMVDSLDSIIDANKDALPGDPIITVEEASTITKAESEKIIKSFFA